MSLPLPVELIVEILSFAIHNHPIPSHILRVNTLFFHISQPLLHTHLHFRSSTQLARFSQAPFILSSEPRTLTLSLAGGVVANFQVFAYLRDALLKCCFLEKQAWNCNGTKVQKGASRKKKVPLDSLRLCLNSHSRDPNLGLIYDALSLADPKTFMWIGPDPEHHFSTAIVPAATPHLFRAIGIMPSLTHLTLTHISFPSLGSLNPDFPYPHAPLLPLLPSLRTVCIGQTTFLSVAAVAAMVCAGRPGWDETKGSYSDLDAGMNKLEQVRLVDAYGESIWGLRIRRSDVEHAALSLNMMLVVEGGGEDESKIVERIRKVVICERKTERIMGGDRVDSAILY